MELLTQSEVVAALDEHVKPSPAVATYQWPETDLGELVVPLLADCHAQMAKDLP